MLFVITALYAIRTKNFIARSLDDIGGQRNWKFFVPFVQKKSSSAKEETAKEFSTTEGLAGERENVFVS